MANVQIITGYFLTYTFDGKEYKEQAKTFPDFLGLLNEVPWGAENIVIATSAAGYETNDTTIS